MSGRDAINFAKSPTGAFLGFCLLLGFVLFMAKGFQPAKSKSSSLSCCHESISRCTAATDHPGGAKPKFHPDENSRVRRSRPIARGQPNRTPLAPAPEILPLSLFAETPTGTEATQQRLRALWSPYPLRTDCHGGFSRYPNADHRSDHRGCLSRRPFDNPRRNGSAWHSADGSLARAHCQRQQLDAGLEDRRGTHPLRHRP